MSDESFQVIFCSRSSNVLDATVLTNVKYFVNWGAFLPKKYKKFRCQFVFKSENFAGGLTDNGFVSMDFGRINVYDGTGNTQKLGLIYPVYLTAANSFYNSTNNDNNDFHIDYPSNQTVTIGLKTFANVNMGNMPNYALILNLIGVNDNEILQSN